MCENGIKSEIRSAPGHPSRGQRQLALGSPALPTFDSEEGIAVGPGEEVCGGRGWCLGWHPCGGEREGPPDASRGVPPRKR